MYVGMCWDDAKARIQPVSGAVESNPRDAGRFCLGCSEASEGALPAWSTPSSCWVPAPGPPLKGTRTEQEALGWLLLLQASWRPPSLC